MAVSTLISFPATAMRGEVIEIRASIRHPMETGYRRSAEGAMMPRDLIRRFSCHFETTDQLGLKRARAQIFAADLFASIAANPYMAFHLRATVSGVLEFAWVGDNGFTQRERIAFAVR